MTKQRAAIIKVMRDNFGHFTAEEIFHLAQQVYPSIVRATVYNNLNALVEEGAIRRISQSGEPDRFDRNPMPHEHVICSKCGKVIDIFLPQFLQKLSNETGFFVEDYELVIHAKCHECSIS